MYTGSLCRNPSVGRALPVTGFVLIPRKLGKKTHGKQCIADFVGQETYFMLVVAFTFESSLKREDFKSSPNCGDKAH